MRRRTAVLGGAVVVATVVVAGAVIVAGGRDGGAAPKRAHAAMVATSSTTAPAPTSSTTSTTAEAAPVATLQLAGRDLPDRGIGVVDQRSGATVLVDDDDHVLARGTAAPSMVVSPEAVAIASAPGDGTVRL